ncbi:3-oxoacyl-ACP synthase [uncultured Maribacter sp.]|uniref:3-oxoacyl-ACP synthase n=1 Tax=uncultured Maribacter sp. TaxID=431308 RepID=UPI002610A675|nr:3-oxoacyl-ACP synthase [uncultured Maribacter sp.]
MPTISLKEDAFQFCKDYIKNRFNRIQNQIQEIQTALTTETKSSAGDKHETGRAMLQLEREKLGQQLAEVEKVSQVLSKINISGKQKYIGPGTLVKTNGFHYFICISAGEYVHNEARVYCVSAATPIARILIGKETGDVVFFNGKEIKVKEVF